MAGVFPSETTIYIAAANAVASGLAASDKIVGEIEKWSLTGGDQEVESVPVIGGFVDKEKPRTQFEVSFDVIISNTAASTLDRFDTFKYGSTLKSSGEGSDKMIWIQSQGTGSSLWKVFAFNNAKAITWEPGMSADDMLRGTITFKFSPTTSAGVANLQTSTVTTSNSWPTSWT